MLLLKMKKKRDLIINLIIWKKKLSKFVEKNLKIKIIVDNIKYRYILKSYTYIN